MIFCVNPWNSKKEQNNEKYIEPKIKAVELDTEQAILEVCAVGGIYLSGTSAPWCGHTLAGGAGPVCKTTPKGVTGGISRMMPTGLGGDATPSSAPS